jgi:hypothetical protein
MAVSIGKVQISYLIRAADFGHCIIASLLYKRLSIFTNAPEFPMISFRRDGQTLNCSKRRRKETFAFVFTKLTTDDSDQATSQAMNRSHS